MARDEEQRRLLAEIERRFIEDDPVLARRLAHLGSARWARRIVAIVLLLASFVLGLAVVAFGAEVGVWPLSVAGFALTVLVPTLIVWRVWVRGRGSPP
ncbi:hypothetical protein B1813_21310 [Saccharomonospora piscinae]|uniref:DUF3040 domain-containing protein n=1 Tax=Saccharomonospora piscinae TaxID=687388 RepID=A0A1V8ZXH9_SACPI|nr:DUF3040 domain-containing protein [Saccharomonospora piscinae]OQO89476.1 hypothetical protein B1813_21310 [Saccharomonospora piscinae]